MDMVLEEEKYKGKKRGKLEEKQELFEWPSGKRLGRTEEANGVQQP